MEAGQHINRPPLLTASPTSSVHEVSPLHHSQSPPESHSHPARLSSTDQGASLGSAPHTASDASGSGFTVIQDTLTDYKRSRACESCRQLKVRCDSDSEKPDGPCKRCAKAKRACIVTAPARKRQKKEHRVEELERRIDALTASLQASRAQIAGANGTASSSQTTSEQASIGDQSWPGQPVGRQADGSTFFPPRSIAGTKRYSGGGLKKGFASPLTPLSSQQRTSSEDGPPSGAYGEDCSGTGDKNWPPSLPLYEALPQPRVEDEYRDVIDRGIVDVETATNSFNRYVNGMAPNAPFVVFAPGTTMADVRRTKPILFLTILYISIGVFRPQLQLPLQNEVDRIFADRVLVKGKKSLELVQALLVATVWYLPPEHYEELKFYQLIHTAAVMGMDLGMNRKAKSNAKTLSAAWKEALGNKAPLVDPESLDVRRTWLGCYVTAVNISMSLRRSFLIRWQAYNDESIEMLKNSPDALPTDNTIIQWAKLARIGEDISFQFSMNDPTTNVNITDPKSQYALKGFERQLEEWRSEVSPDNYPPIMEHYQHTLSIYMHEIGMHVDHNIDDFKPPFLGDIGEESSAELGTAVHVDALTVCLTSIHKAFQLFTSIELQDLACLPTIHFVRTTYAAVALVKLFSLATASGSRLGHIFTPADFKIDYFFDKIIHHLRASGDMNGGRVSAKFAQLMNMLQSWYNRHKDKRQALIVPRFFQTKESEEGDGDSSSLKSPPTTDRPTPLHVLSEVATVGSQNSGVKRIQGDQSHSPPIPFANANESHSMQTYPNANIGSLNQATPSAPPPGVLMTPYMNQQMGIGPSQASNPGIGAYQTTYDQHQSTFAQMPGSLPVEQQEFWQQNLLPDAGLNLAFAFGNVWDDDLFPLAFDWNERNS